MVKLKEDVSELKKVSSRDTSETCAICGTKVYMKLSDRVSNILCVAGQQIEAIMLL